MKVAEAAPEKTRGECVCGVVGEKENWFKKFFLLGKQNESNAWRCFSSNDEIYSCNLISKVIKARSYWDKDNNVEIISMIFSNQVLWRRKYFKCFSTLSSILVAGDSAKLKANIGSCRFSHLSSPRVNIDYWKVQQSTINYRGGSLATKFSPDNDDTFIFITLVPSGPNKLLTEDFKTTLAIYCYLSVIIRNSFHLNFLFLFFLSRKRW